MHQLTNRIVPLGDLVSAAFTRRFAECMTGGRSQAESVRSVIAFLRDVFAPRRRTVVEEAVCLLSEGATSVEAVARHVGRSARQIERLFQDEVGVSPRELVRVLRFSRAVGALKKGGGTGAELALDLGYYDQSHMIREMRRFSSATPRQLASRLVGLTGVFASP
jgi:AraC-like DNA-binding protein